MTSPLTIVNFITNGYLQFIIVFKPLLRNGYFELLIFVNISDDVMP